MAINVKIKLYIKNNPQQRNPRDRRRTYERAVAFWVANSTLPIVAVETSGADLESLRRLVFPERAINFEFLSLPARNLHDIGASRKPTLPPFTCTLARTSCNVLTITLL